jgi:hypothetical protein
VREDDGLQLDALGLGSARHQHDLVPTRAQAAARHHIFMKQ